MNVTKGHDFFYVRRGMHWWKIFRACLASKFEYTFEHFKQYDTYFYTLFYLHVYQKHSNNISQTSLPNRP